MQKSVKETGSVIVVASEILDIDKGIDIEGANKGMNENNKQLNVQLTQNNEISETGI